MASIMILSIYIIDFIGTMLCMATRHSCEDYSNEKFFSNYYS